MKRIMNVLILSLVVLALFACKKDQPESKAVEDAVVARWLGCSDSVCTGVFNNGVTINSDGSLYLFVLDTVTYEYTSETSSGVTITSMSGGRYKISNGVEGSYSISSVSISGKSFPKLTMTRDGGSTSYYVKWASAMRSSNAKAILLNKTWLPQSENIFSSFK